MTKVIKTTPKKAYEKLSSKMNNGQKEDFKKVLRGSKEVFIHLNINKNTVSGQLINENIINQIIFLHYNGKRYGLKQIDKLVSQISKPIFKYNSTYNCFAILYDKYCFLYHDSNRNFRRFKYNDYSNFEYMLNTKDNKFELNYIKQFEILQLNKFFSDDFYKFANHEINIKFRDVIRGAREDKFKEKEKEFYNYFIQEIKKQGFLNAKSNIIQKNNEVLKNDGIIYLDNNGITLKASKEAKPGNEYEYKGEKYYIAKDKNDLIGKIFDEDYIPKNIITTFVTDMSELFFEKKKFNKDISNWDTSNVINMSGMFQNAISFNKNIGNWNVSNVKDMSYMFSGPNKDRYSTSTHSFNNGGNDSIKNWNTSNVTNMEGMFNGAISFNQPIGNWNVSKVTNMSKLFYNAKIFNQDISNWNTSNVTNMKGMFMLTDSFNQPIGNWNVSKVTDMSDMFYGTQSFNQSLNNWNTSNVTDMSNSFNSAKSFNQPIGNWNVSKVTDMEGMFNYANEFNQDISNWNVSNVTNMRQMFQHLAPFNQDISKWNVSKVTDMYQMFNECKSFNQDISKWNVSNVTDMFCMFGGAKTFNQNISNWNVKKVQDSFRFDDESNPKWKKEFKPNFID